MKNSSLIALIAAGLILVTAYSVLSQRTQTGVIEGKVTIGPFSPVEPSTGPTVPLGTYSSRSIILKPWIGETVYVPLNEDGYFHAEVKTGQYEATLSDCVFLGCSNSLPRQVEIKPGETTTLNIDIDTGIR
ncbi:hypothetical protein MUP51_04705 [Candidatus Bathyarchaeota archaeon]|jgi:hypothetical protein|nr:hypothetical protein [Candidatus Bathyarchaeota archaeon]